MSVVPRRARAGVSAENVLILFVKWPAPGFVKTRLARSVGAASAARLYRSLVENALSATADSRGYRRVVFYTPAGRREEIAGWMGSGIELHPQSGRDLGERMSAAFDFTFSGGAGKAVIIGTDVPFLDGKIVHRAFAELDAAPCVIGPSRDGGYYLIGLSKPRPQLFRGIDWGTGRVFRQTRETLDRLGLRCAVLEELLDLDDIDDLREIARPPADAGRSGNEALQALAAVIGNITGERGDAV